MPNDRRRNMHLRPKQRLTGVRRPSFCRWKRNSSVKGSTRKATSYGGLPTVRERGRQREEFPIRQTCGYGSLTEVHLPLSTALHRDGPVTAMEAHGEFRSSKCLLGQSAEQFKTVRVGHRALSSACLRQEGIKPAAVRAPSRDRRFLQRVALSHTLRACTMPFDRAVAL